MSNLHLYVMRNGPSCSGRVTDDFHRTLTPPGKQVVKYQAARFCQPDGIRPDCIFCSTATRSRQTAALLSDMFVGTPIFPRESLYLATAFRILSVLRETDIIFQRILLIGHAPGLEQLTAVLTHPDLHYRFEPAACLSFALSVSDWQALTTGVAHIDNCFPTNALLN